MKVKELEGLTSQELSDKLKELNKRLMELQFKRKTGAEKPHLFKQVKKDIARMKTLLTERELRG